MKAEERHEIKRNDLQAVVAHVSHWIAENARTLVLAFAALVVVSLGVVLFIFWQSSQRNQANVALAEALDLIHAPLVEEGADPEGEAPSFADEASRRAAARSALEEVRSRFGSSQPGQIALAYLGDLAAREGDLDEARRLWQSFLDSQSDHLLSANIRQNLYSLARATGGASELAEELRSAIANESGSLPTDVLLWELGLTLEALDDEDARTSFQRLVDEYPASAYTARARERLGPVAQSGALSFGS